MNRSQSSSSFRWIIIGSVVAVVAVGAGAFIVLRSAPAKLTMDPIAKQTVDEAETLTVTPVVHLEGVPEKELKFGIISGPPGAKINPKTGVFSWKPSESQGPQSHKVELAAKTTGTQKLYAARKFTVVVKEVNSAPVVLDVGHPTIAAGETVKLLIRATDPDEPPQAIEYRFGKSIPAGARLDPNSGSFEWRAPESSEEHDEVVDVIVLESEEKEPLKQEIQFKIHVTALTSAADRMAAALKESGLDVEKIGGDAPEGFTGVPKGYEVKGELITVLEYETPAAAEADLKQISDDGQTLFGKAYKWSATTRIYQAKQLIVMYAGAEPKTLQALEKQLTKPVIVANAATSEPMPEKTEVVVSVSEKLGQSLAALAKEKKLLNKKEYASIRKLFASQFAEQRKESLEPIYAGEGAALKKWFDGHPELMEEFYIAVAPEDDLAKSLSILTELQQKFPRQFEDYFSLAIATAVTWDQDAGVYDYKHHAARTHSKYPEEILGAVDTFKYFLDAEKIMQGRAQYLPWEFLKHLVNDRTPRSEREWAAQNYLNKRVGIGKCYSQVPYDFEMLKTESRVCKLDGKDYTLANIVSAGGVCAQQADFASRVGKSIGVPAEYVRGQGRFGGYHAWVMWIELKEVTKTGIAFSLESYGRYFDDNYYVGTLDDPQTGKEITDRELELRLHAVGMDPIAYRQTRLIMSAYPVLSAAAEWDTKDEIVFLNDVIEMCPGNEEAWRAVARLARDGKVETASYRLINVMFGKLFTTFARFPDFTWTVFDDLVSFQKNVKQRNRYFEQLVQMYEAAGRPDLSCEARMQLSDYLLEDGKTKEVLAGLAYTIKKFPDEGVFVPKLLDKLESVAANIKGSEPAVLQLYQELIPLIPQKRGDSVSKFYLQMLGRASDKFRAAGQLQQAQVYAQQAATLKAKGE